MQLQILSSMVDVLKAGLDLVSCSGAVWLRIEPGGVEMTSLCLAKSCPFAPPGSKQRFADLPLKGIVFDCIFACLAIVCLILFPWGDSGTSWPPPPGCSQLTKNNAPCGWSGVVCFFWPREFLRLCGGSGSRVFGVFWFLLFLRFFVGLFVALLFL